MSLGPPPPRLGAFRRDAALFSAGQSRALSGCAILGRTNLGAGRAYCLFSGGGDRRKQEEARGALESALGQKKTGFEKWGMGVEKRQQRDRRGGPGPAASGGGGRSGGGGAWLRWFSSGGFWDAAKQTVLTILGIIAAFFLIANFNVLVAALVNPLLIVLRQIRRALSFAAHCVYRGTSAPTARTKSPPLDSGVLAPVPVKGRVGMSAKERVLRKWGSD